MVRIHGEDDLSWIDHPKDHRALQEAGSPRAVVLQMNLTGWAQLAVVILLALLGVRSYDVS